MTARTVFLVSEPKIKKGRKRKMSDTATANPVIEQETEDTTQGVYKGKGNKKVLNPFTGKEEVREGSFSIPLASDEDHAKELVPNAADRVFWFNAGRKQQARIQMYSLFDDIFGDEKLNEDYASFILAYEQVVTDKTSDERKAKVREFILGEEKFADLKVKLEEVQNSGGLKPIVIDYAVDELKKPSGVRGKRAKAVESPVTE